jgi:hypothetical protein
MSSATGVRTDSPTGATRLDSVDLKLASHPNEPTPGAGMSSDLPAPPLTNALHECMPPT